MMVLGILPDPIAECCALWVRVSSCRGVQGNFGPSVLLSLE